MKILYTTPILEYPAAGGPQLRIQNSIKALSKVCNLHILHLALVPSKSVDVTDLYFRQFSESYLTLYRYPSSRFLRFAYKVFRKFSGFNFDRAINYKVVRTIKEKRIKVVWFGFGNISYPLISAVKRALPDVKVICDTDSVWSQFILRELPYVEGCRRAKIARAGSLKEGEELAWANLCEVTTAVSEVDAQYYRGIATDSSRIHVFSNVIDLENYRTIPDPPNKFVQPCIFLAGSYGPNSAMNMAANWVLDEVLPIIRKTHPNLHFYIVGRNSDREFGCRAGPNITVTGQLDSVLPYLFHADVALVPLKFESGTRFKILEAGACRIPIVSTTLGAEGISVEDGKHLLIADSPNDFAAAILRFLGDRSYANRLAQNCFELVKEKYDVSALVIEANKILEYLKND
jgi:glycosyltransferase involved in cell wall biosynthesis